MMRKAIMKLLEMSTMKRALGCAALLVLPLTVHAAVAGKFQFVAGGVAVVDGQGKSRPAQKGGDVSEGETLVTEANGAAQVRMVDGGLIALRPDTRMTVSTYRFNGKEDGSESAVFSLLKGGLRAITGVIGKTHKENYQIKTANATIGIRGTDHEAFVVPAAQGGIGSTGGIAPGTYDKVNVGATSLRTDTGVAVIGPNQVGFAASAAQPPVLLPRIPDIFRAAPAPQAHQAQNAPAQTATQDTSASASSGTASTSSTGDATTSTASTSVATAPATSNLTGVNSSGASLNTLNQTITSTSGSATPIGADMVRAVGAVNNWRVGDYVFSFTGPSDPNVSRGAVDGGVQPPSQVIEDASGVIGFNGKVFGYTPVGGTALTATGTDTLAAIRIGTAVNQELGTTSLSGVPVSWGRWVGGAVDVYTADGAQKLGTIDNSNRSVHWVTIGAISGTSFSQLPLTGSATYTLVGGTKPTDLQGNVGTLGPVTLSADFTNARASASINASFNAPTNTSSWSMTANNVPFSPTPDEGFKSTTAANGINGITHTVTCTGPSCGAQSIGYVDGHFVMNAQGAVMFYGMASGKQISPGDPTAGIPATFTPINMVTGLAVLKK
jgi:hypothetical protein